MGEGVFCFYERGDRGRSDRAHPSLLKQARMRAVVISDGDNDLGAIVSMEDYEIVRKAKVERLMRAMDALGAELRAGAAEEGISVDELEKMLDRKAPQSRD